MPEEETSQESTEETSQEGESEETSTQEESAVATEESQEQESQSQMAQDYAALQTRFTQTQQEIADVRSTNAQYEAHYRQQQQQADPLDALYAAQAEANSIGDTAAAAQTQRKIDDIRQQHTTYNAAQAAMQATQVQQGLGSAAEMAGGNFTMQEFQAVRQDMTPEEAALVKRHRAGTLGEVYDKQRQERSAVARAGQSGASGRGRGPKSSAPTDSDASVTFNPKRAFNLKGKALDAYIKSCDPATVHDDWKQ